MCGKSEVAPIPAVTADALAYRAAAEGDDTIALLGGVIDAQADAICGAVR